MSINGCFCHESFHFLSTASKVRLRIEATAPEATTTNARMMFSNRISLKADVWHLLFSRYLFIRRSDNPEALIFISWWLNTSTKGESFWKAQPANVCSGKKVAWR